MEVRKNLVEIVEIAKSFARYNLMFTQALNILIPCNRSKVGDIISCALLTKSGKATTTDGEKVVSI